MQRYYYVYLMTNVSRTLYVGMTNDLVRRVWEHKQKAIEGFTKRYNITRLAYYEVFTEVLDAIAREKQIKGWDRAKKLTLVEATNPGWRDLYRDITSVDENPALQDSSQARNDRFDAKQNGQTEG